MEDFEIDVIENAKMMSALQVDQVKLHALYIVKGTQMAKEYEDGALKLISKEEYMERAFFHIQVFLSNMDIYLYPCIWKWSNRK